MGEGLQAVAGRRSGANDEATGCAAEGHGEEDHLVGGSGDYWGDRPDHEAVAGTPGGAWLLWAGRPAEGTAERQAGGVGDSRNGAAAVPGDLLRPEHPPLSREVEGSARHRTELHVGADGAARRWSGGPSEQARQASPA